MFKRIRTFFQMNGSYSIIPIAVAIITLIFSLHFISTCINVVNEIKLHSEGIFVYRISEGDFRKNKDDFECLASEFRRLFSELSENNHSLYSIRFDESYAICYYSDRDVEYLKINYSEEVKNRYSRIRKVFDSGSSDYAYGFQCVIVNDEQVVFERSNTAAIVYTESVSKPNIIKYPNSDEEVISERFGLHWFQCGAKR